MGEKRFPTDFALWKFSPKGHKRQMEWDSPWGVGFPGWHIECSAMSAKYLGPFFDIHCGGEDHIPVHHTNEIAQTEACHGTRLANFWMHGYFLQLGEARMSKSAGVFLRMQEILDRGYDPLVFRLFCLGAHYQAKLSFGWEGLDSAAIALERLRTACYEWGAPGAVDEESADRFVAQIYEDLNMPRALAVVWELVRSDLPPSTKKATLLLFDQVLGLGLADWAPKAQTIPAEIQELMQKRQLARQEKRWKEADELRAQILNAGFEVLDGLEGSKIKTADSRRPTVER
jgi:cysteinyl-tRNA synthetase